MKIVKKATSQDIKKLKPQHIFNNMNSNEQMNYIDTNKLNENKKEDRKIKWIIEFMNYCDLWKNCDDCGSDERVLRLLDDKDFNNCRLVCANCAKNYKIIGQWSRTWQRDFEQDYQDKLKQKEKRPEEYETRKAFFNKK